MHGDCVPPETASVTRDLADAAARHELALGGGTACALRLGHRTSDDLDFFSLSRLDTTALLSAFEGLGERRLRGITDAEPSLVLGGVEVSATSLGRAPLADPGKWLGISVLSIEDLAELKVEAAVRRGMTRDLCDLHLLCLAGADLEAAIRAGTIDLVVALKALTDAARFERQPALALRTRWSVEDAVGYFEVEARRLFG